MKWSEAGIGTKFMSVLHPCPVHSKEVCGHSILILTVVIVI